MNRKTLISKTHKGSILVSVLIMMAFLVSITILVFEKSSTSYQGVVMVQADNQGAIYAGSALTAIRTLMEYDDPDYDAPTDEWTVLPGIPVGGGGYVIIDIRPADDRLPVNAMANADDNISKRVRDAFDLAFSELELEADLWRAMRDWVNSSEAVPMSVDVQGVTFNSEGNTYRAKYGPLTTLAELRLLPGVSQVYNELTQNISIGETDPKININFANELTIRALMPELEPFVDQIIEFRQDTPFKKKDDLYTLLGNSNRDIYTAVLPYFDVKSTLFYVKVEVNLLDSQQFFHALMRKNGRRFTVVRYIEGRAINYF